jgi:dolichyl-phosphate-mannose-protein mannosyltransferase
MWTAPDLRAAEVGHRHVLSVPTAYLASNASYVRTVVLLACLATFYIVTLPTGIDWGDDFAMYIHHAKNIVLGLPYAATGYIYNPHNPGIGPTAYPPGYPLLLAPIYSLVGLDFQPMRFEIVAFLVADLALIAALFWNEVGAHLTVLLMALVGLSPGVWALSSQILSDIPFLFFCLAALLQLRRFEQHRSHRTNTTAVALAITCALAYATRTAGLVLVATALASDLNVNRRLTRWSFVVVVVFSAMAALQRIAFGSTDSYLDQLVLAPGGLRDVVVLNLKNYVLYLVTLFGTPTKDVVALPLTFACLSLGAIGFIRVARPGPNALVSFSVIYTVVLIVWPNFQGVRFMLPLLPMYVFFVIRGIEWLIQAAQPSLRAAVGVIAALIVAIFYANFYLQAYYGPIKDGASEPSAQEMFATVKQRTAADSVVVFVKPRALALFTDRRSSGYFSPADSSELMDYFRDINASYVVVGPMDAEWSNRYILPDTRHFDPVWSNSRYTLLRVHFEA